MEEVIGSITKTAVFKPQYPATDLGQFHLREHETECAALTKAVSGHHILKDLVGWTLPLFAQLRFVNSAPPAAIVNPFKTSRRFTIV